MAARPSSADMALTPHIKQCFTAQGGRGIDPAQVAQYIKTHIPSYHSIPEEEIRDGVIRMIAFWKNKHAQPSAAAPASNAAAKRTEESSEDDGEQRPMMHLTDGNLMNQQLRASMAVAKGAAGATRAAAIEAAAMASSTGGSSKKRKAQDSPSRRRRKRETGKLRSGDGHNRAGGGPDREAERHRNGDARSSSEFEAAERPTARLRDMGGVEPCLQAIRELIEWPLAHPEVYGHLGVVRLCTVRYLTYISSCKLRSRRAGCTTWHSAARPARLRQDALGERDRG